MATVTFLEAGTDATQDLSFFTATAGTVASATDFFYTGLRSIKLSTGSPAVTASVQTPNSVIADTGSRISARYRFSTTTPAAAAPIMILRAAPTSTVVRLRLTTAGKLQLDNGATAITTGTTILSINTFYRITVAYTITSTTNYRFDVYIDGAFEFSATPGATLSSITTTHVLFEVGNQVGVNVNVWVDDIYIDNGSDYTDTGNIQVTAKRPFANGTLNEWTTQIGAGSSSYGSGHAPQVNEQPLSTTDGWSITSVTLKTETYTIEGPSVGDLDITGYGIVDSMGWVYTKVASASTGNIVVNGTATNISVTTSYALFSKVAGTTGYLNGAAAIGMDTNTVNQLFSLAECGVLVAIKAIPWLPVEN